MCVCVSLVWIIVTERIHFRYIYKQPYNIQVNTERRYTRNKYPTTAFQQNCAMTHRVEEKCARRLPFADFNFVGFSFAPGYIPFICESECDFVYSCWWRWAKKGMVGLNLIFFLSLTAPARAPFSFFFNFCRPFVKQRSYCIFTMLPYIVYMSSGKPDALP